MTPVVTYSQDPTLSHTTNLNKPLWRPSYREVIQWTAILDRRITTSQSTVDREVGGGGVEWGGVEWVGVGVEWVGMVCKRGTDPEPSQMRILSVSHLIAWPRLAGHDCGVLSDICDIIYDHHTPICTRPVL